MAIPVFVGAGLCAERAGSIHAQTCPYAPTQSPVFVGAGLRAERARSIHAQTCPHAPTAIPVFVGAGLCAERARSTHAQPCPYAPTERSVPKQSPVFCRGRSTRGEGRVNPCTDLPLRADRGVLCQSNPLCFVGAGLRAERARSIHAQTCPYAPTAAFCAKAIPCFCRGRSTRGESNVNPCTDLPLRADRGVLCRPNPRFCRGRSTRGEGRVNPYTDLPLRADRGVLCQSNPLFL